MTAWIRRFFRRARRHVQRDASGYFQRSVPYGIGSDNPESPALRAKRIACSAANHHPRVLTGSWCWGYGYVCGRCHMYADPWNTAEREAAARAVGSR